MLDILAALWVVEFVRGCLLGWLRLIRLKLSVLVDVVVHGDFEV